MTPVKPEVTVAGELTDAPKMLLSRMRAVAEKNGAKRTSSAKRTRRKTASFSGMSGAGADARDPKLLGAVFDQLADNKDWEPKLMAGRVLAHWTDIVPAVLADSCRAESMDGTALIVRCDSPAWANQLKPYEVKIIELMASRLGTEVVTEIRTVSVQSRRVR
ncbi:DciA family protein [Glutamicibacter ardleyensis]|uniref:DciA family protein n=1 Tax=Glutamicibacter ardleyensis TaxID=225894 RepID=UPI003FD14919